MEQRIAQSPQISGAGTKLIVGLFFAVLGILLTADNLDFFDAEPFLIYWPAAVVLIGVLQVVAGSRALGVILTVVGASLLAMNAGWLRFSIFDLWPLLLIGMGGAMVARSMGYKFQVPTTGDGTVWAILSTRKISETTRDYKGSNIISFMGSCELDLTQADISRGPAVIDVVAIWSGVEISVSDRWEIVGEVVPLMGGFEITTASTSNPDKQLIVRGLALMGGIEVKGRKS